MDTGTVTVAELARGIEAALASWFAGEIWVSGEISGLRRSNNGHAYFQLVERGDDHRTLASIDVTLFDSARRYVNTQLKSAGGVRMTDGTQVRIRGRLELYAPNGRLQIRMSGIDPAYTLALLVSERDRVAGVLEAEGLLGRNARTTLPLLPLRVGLATSDGSAAMADFVHELQVSGFAWQVRLIHVPVQGHGADRLLARAIDVLTDADVDVVVLVRGGGSRVDLATFDSEALGRAIAASPVPVLTGIGHEIDTSVADAAAHSSYKTPTACAAALVERVSTSLERAEAAWTAVPVRARAVADRLDRRLTNEIRALPHVARARIDRATARVESGSRHVQSEATRRAVSAGAQLHVDEERLRRASARSLERSGQRLALAEVAVAGVDPTRLMRRGWSITRTSGGSVVRTVDDVVPGERLTTTVVDGAILSDAVVVVPTTETSEGARDDTD